MKLNEKLAERKEYKELNNRIADLEEKIGALKAQVDLIDRHIDYIERIVPDAQRQTYKAMEAYLKENVTITFRKMEEGLIMAELKKRMLDNIFGEKNETKE